MKAARLIGSLKVTSMDETAELRGLGETAAIEVTVRAGCGDHVGDGAAGAGVVRVAGERPGVGVGAGARMGGAAEVQQALEVRRVRRLHARRRSGGGVRVAVGRRR